MISADRKMIAAHALAGMLANQEGLDRVWQKAKELHPDDLAGAATDAVEIHLAATAVSLADALLKELKKK